MVDKTQEDINQDKRIDALESQVRVLARSIDSLHASFDDFTIAVHKHDRLIKAIDPLEVLVAYVDHIKEFFDAWRKGFVK